MLKDLELTSKAMSALDNRDHMYEVDQENEAIVDYNRLMQREDENRKRLGDHLFDALPNMKRWQVQRSFRRDTALTTKQLSWLYGLPNPTFMASLGNVWEEVVRTTPLRIQIGELPTRPGSSDAFIEHVDEQVEAFKKKWDWLICPLVVPVALEVMVR